MTEPPGGFSRLRLWEPSLLDLEYPGGLVYSGGGVGDEEVGVVRRRRRVGVVGGLEVGVLYSGPLVVPL